MASTANSEAITDILLRILEEHPLRIDGGSSVLVSDNSIARSVFAATEPVRTPYGPLITVASRGQPDTTQVDGIQNGHVVQVDKLDINKYSHVIFGVLGEDPKYILQGLKYTREALQPKGYAIVISIKVEAKETGEGEGKFTVSLEDKLKYQSKGKVNSLGEVLEYAGFERGRIRSFEKSSKGIDAEVILAMKWDQLTG